MLKKDIVFKALTRPAMFMGIPIMPFFIGLSFSVLLGVYTQIQYVIVILPIMAILKLITNSDEKIFQLIGIKRFLFSDKIRASKYKKLYKGNYYTSADYSKSRLKTPINDKKDYLMLDLEKAIQLKKIIPFSSLIDENVILTKNGELMTTWQIEGISYETRSDDELDYYKEQLNGLIKSFASENLSFYVHNCRMYSSLKSHHSINNEFAKSVNDEYIQSFNKSDFMENNLFFTAIFKPNNFSKKNKSSEVKDSLMHFKELTGRIQSSLNKFGAIYLSSYEEKGVLYSEQLSFYNFLLTGQYQKIRVLKTPIYNYLGNIEMICAKDMAQINYADKKMFIRGIEIKDWVQETDAGLLDSLIGLKCRYVITQSFTTISKNEAKSLVDKQLKQLQSAEDDGLTEMNDLLIAKDDLIKSSVSFGTHHFTLMIYAESVEEVQQQTNDAMSLLTDEGFIVTLSNIALDESIFSQLPANFKFRPRTSLITSKNFSGLNSLHNNPSGKSNNNCWGNAVTTLKTSTNTPFYFNFHQTKIGRSDFGDMHLAHTLILGKSGTGKTVLSTFLLSQLMAFDNPETFPANAVNKKFTAVYLDKDYGAEIAVKALGGHYNRLNNGKTTNFNPFMLDNTPENISFLNSLIAILAGGESHLTVKEKTAIDFAVKAVMSTDKEFRSFGITRLLESIQDDNNNDNSLKKRLNIWKKGEVNGWVFDNERDHLSFDDFAVYGFDGTDILDNTSIINPLSFYLLHRVSMILDGRRVVLFLDEFWKWLLGEAFEKFTYDGLKTFRKRNGFLVMATQSPDEILRNPIARAIIEQVETFIFLPNSKADEKEYINEFKVSQKEYNLIKGLADDSRMFLIKKGSENDNRGNAVLAKLDLSSLDKGNLKVLSGSTDSIALLDNIIKKTGSDPKKWLPEFKKEVK